MPDSPRPAPSKPGPSEQSSSEQSSSEQSSSAQAPLVRRHRVRFGESDAARIAYTGRFPLWALEAVEDWFDLWANHDWYEINVARGFGTPFVRLELDIAAPLRPRETLAMTVLIARVGRASITFQVEGRRDDGRLCFTSKLTCVTAATREMRAIPIPAALRARIEAYRAACAAAGATAGAAPAAAEETPNGPAGPSGVAARR